MAEGKMSVDVLIHNACVISMDSKRRIFFPGAVTIKGRRIAHVGPDKAIKDQVSAASVIDAGGGVVHPGFIDTHCHAAHGSLRCSCPDKIDWDQTTSMFLTQYWNTVEDEHEKAGCTVAALDMIRAGTTCFLEPGTAFEPGNIVEMAETIGIRAFVGDGFILDLGVKVSGPLQVSRAPKSTREAVQRVGKQLFLNKDPDRLARGCIVLAGSGTATDELFSYAKQVAKREGAILTAHQSWHRNDMQMERDRFGCSSIRHYDELKVLDRSTLLSQVNFLEDDDIERLVRSDTSIVWAPVVAGLWTTGGGKSRHAEVFRRGGNVALGTDGTITGIPIDLSNAARQAIVLSREDGLGVNTLAAEDTFEMMTIGGARALGVAEELGSLEPGKRADIVMRSTELWDFVPHGHLVAQLIFAARSRGVDTVFIDGQMVFRKGVFPHLDENQLRASANEVVSRLMRKMDWNIQSPWPIVTGSS